MRLFFHHVGQKGADEDFKKTVYKDISIQAVENNVPVSYPHRDELLIELRQQFPSGLFNCWGVPAGAKMVIGQLAAGDFVLLVHTATEYGEVPVLCHVRLRQSGFAQRRTPTPTVEVACVNGGAVACVEQET